MEGMVQVAVDEDLAGPLYSPQEVQNILSLGCKPWMQTRITDAELKAAKAKRGKTTRRLRYRVYEYKYPLDGILGVRSPDGAPFLKQELLLMVRRAVESPLLLRDPRGRTRAGQLAETQPNGTWAVAAWRIVERRAQTSRRRDNPRFEQEYGSWDRWSGDPSPQRTMRVNDAGPVYVLQVVYVDEAVQPERDPLYDRTRQQTSPLYPYVSGEAEDPPPMLAQHYDLAQEIIDQWLTAKVGVVLEDEDEEGEKENA